MNIFKRKKPMAVRINYCCQGKNKFNVGDKVYSTKLFSTDGMLAIRKKYTIVGITIGRE
jgi:hypothetical protein